MPYLSCLPHVLSRALFVSGLALVVACDPTSGPAARAPGSDPCCVEAQDAQTPDPAPGVDAGPSPRDADSEPPSLGLDGGCCERAPRPEGDAQVADAATWSGPTHVLIIGDSYFAMDPELTHDSQPMRQELERLARDAGALGDDEHYRDRSKSYASFLPLGTLPHIPTQYEDARAEAPDIRCLILTGGGNDAIFSQPGCLAHADADAWAQDPSCVAGVKSSLDAVRELLDKAQREQVAAAIFVGYGPMGGFVKALADYVSPLQRALCEDERPGFCHFVNMRTYFDLDADGVIDPPFVAADGRHPSAMGARVMAREVWATMSRACEDL